VIILEYIEKADIKEAQYVLPINDDLEQLENATSTMNMIRNIDESAIIYLILNRCINVNCESAIKEQFISIFGSQKYGIESSLHMLKNVELLFVPNSPIFGILKNIYQTSLLDFIESAEDLIENIDTYRLSWIDEGREKFRENMKKYAFAKDVIELKNQLKSFEVLR